MNKYMGIGVFFLMAAGVLSAATPRYVATNGPGPAPYTSWTTAGSNILEVVNYANTANAGDTVYISNGTYYLTNTVVISNTIVKGFSGDYRDVIVDGQASVRCFRLSDGKTPGLSELHGVTVTNGDARSSLDYNKGNLMSPYGGGITLCDFSMTVDTVAGGGIAGWRDRRSGAADGHVAAGTRSGLVSDPPRRPDRASG